MVRRWTDQSYAGSGVANAGNIVVDLTARQFSTLTGLGTLRNLDLNFVRVGQVPDRDAESSGGNLLDGRSFGVSVLFPKFWRLANSPFLKALKTSSHNGKKKRTPLPTSLLAAPR